MKRAKKQQERTIELPPWRGAITDRDGTPLAVTALADSLFAIPSDVDDAPRTAALLAPVLNQPARELRRKLQEDDRDFVWLSRRVPEAVAVRVAALRLPGVRLWKESTRRYPEGSLAASVLGYVGTDNQGLAGLEYRYDSEIRGRPARVTLLRDAAQRLYATRRRDGTGEAAVSDGVEGASLELTLDTAVQHVLERELARGVATWHCRGGSAVILDPADGAILALASVPGFDPNRWSEATEDARRCRPLADAYEPGSTFKIVAAAASLDAGTIAPDDLIDCGNGSLTIGSTTIHEHGHKAWSALPLGDILAYSSNIGIAHVALGLGRGAFYRSVRAFGFGQKTGLDLDGESAGLLEEPASWSALTLPTMAFGQEIGVTVLQMARAYAAVANGGRLPVPYLVSRIRTGNDELRSMAPAPPVRVISSQTARILRHLLQRVVEVGTGKLGAIPGYTAAGKTGTAQKAIPGGGYSREKFVASFIGFAPASSPRVVIAVVLDEPQGKTYGGDVAAPIFSAVGGEVLRHLGVPPSVQESDRPSVLTADLSAGRAAAAPPDLRREDLLPAANRPDEESEGAGRVPDVTGLPARDAVRSLVRRDLLPRLSGTGFVVSQDPAAGSPLQRGSVCTLVLSLTGRVTGGAAGSAAPTGLPGGSP